MSNKFQEWVDEKQALIPKPYAEIFELTGEGYTFDSVKGQDEQIRVYKDSPGSFTFQIRCFKPITEKGRYGSRKASAKKRNMVATVRVSIQEMKDILNFMKMIDGLQPDFDGELPEIVKAWKQRCADLEEMNHHLNIENEVLLSRLNDTREYAKKQENSLRYYSQKVKEDWGKHINHLEEAGEKIMLLEKEIAELKAAKEGV